MKITLRKAAQVQAEIVKRIGELSEPMSVAMEVNSAANPVETQKQNIENFEKSLVSVGELTRIQYLIRGQVARVNHESGISQLLTRDAYLNAESKRLSNIARVRSVAQDAALLEASYLAKLEQQKTSAPNIYGRSSTETITLELLTEKTREQMKAKLLEFKRERNQIADQILALNVSTHVEVQDQDWASLESLGVV